MTRLHRLLGFIEHDPGNLSLRKDAICAASEAGHWDVARDLIDAGLRAYPGEAELLAHSGAAHMYEQSFAEAEQVLAAATRKGVDAPAVHYNLAYARFMQKRYAQALDGLGAPVLQALPLALVLRARCLHHLGRRDEAIAACRERLAAAPADAETNGVLALLLQEQGEVEAARKLAEAALSENPRQLEARLALASLQVDAQEYDAAQRSFDTLLELYPQCGRAWFGRALVGLGNGQPEAAKRDIEVAATYTPEHIGTWHVLAWVHVMLGDLPAARSAFEKALTIDRTFGETHGGLAAVAAMEGREKEARAGIKRALRLNPQSLAAKLAELVLLQHEGSPDAARAVLDAALALPSTRGDTLNRDLVAAHMKRLEARAKENRPPATYH
jgi:tetratricopeptide (TPR) repeat protein